MSASDHAAHSKAAARWIKRLPRFASGKRVALYLPFDREMDTAELHAAARRRSLRVFVPVVSDRRHGRMRFHPLQGKTRTGAYGISVPSSHGVPVAARWLDLIVVPLVGVDPDGRRLGMGAGYYDRALEFRRGRRAWTGPYLVGFAFECQRTRAKFAEPWDLRLNSLATEAGLQHFSEPSP